MTNDVVRRTFEHREGAADGITRRHKVKTLVYFQSHDDVRIAIEREKTLKRWRRAWKIQLIERDNSDWRDLFEGIAR